MQTRALTDRLERFPEVLHAATALVSPDDSRWKPASGAWSVNEIVHHLADEEVLDFRPRIERTLAEPMREWDPIDPEGWAAERRYNDGEMSDALDRFTRERAVSIAWLRGIDPDWAREKIHPRFGAISAGSLLAAWAVHDLLHLRQITKRLFELTRRDAAPHDTSYAGEWTA